MPEELASTCFYAANVYTHTHTPHTHARTHARTHIQLDRNDLTACFHPNVYTHTHTPHTLARTHSHARPHTHTHTAGQERFNSMHPSYYHGAHACIMCFDITRKITYTNLSKWWQELQVFCSLLFFISPPPKKITNLSLSKSWQELLFSVSVSPSSFC